MRWDLLVFDLSFVDPNFVAANVPAVYVTGVLVLLTINVEMGLTLFL